MAFAGFIEETLPQDVEAMVRETVRVLKKFHAKSIPSLVYGEISKEKAKELHKIIYNLYCIDSSMHKYIVDIYTLEIKEQYKEKVEKINERFMIALEQAHQIIEKYRERFTELEKKEWIICTLKGVSKNDITRRMYLNCEPDHILTVVLSLMNWAEKYKMNVIFKFPNYKSVTFAELIRADKIVIYYGESGRTHELLRDWVGSVRTFLRPARPMFTRIEREGAAFAFEPTPDQHAFYYNTIGKESSFGSFVALVVAWGILSWSVSHTHLPYSTEDFAEVTKEIIKQLELHKFKKLISMPTG